MGFVTVFNDIMFNKSIKKIDTSRLGNELSLIRAEICKALKSATS